MLFRELERLEDRILCAIRCVDATTRTVIDTPLKVQSLHTPHARIRSNSRGTLVVQEWEPLQEHSQSFLSPPLNPPRGSESLILAIEDPLERYIPRLVRVPLPRPSDLTITGSPEDSESLFVPIAVPMYPSPAAPVEANWSVIRVTVWSENEEGLGGALLRVRRNGTVLGRGLSDWRGEAMVSIAGIPIISVSDSQDAALTRDLEVVLEGVFSPAAGSQTPLSQVRDGPRPPGQTLVDPDALEAGQDELPREQRSLRITARKEVSTTLQINVT